MGDNPDNEQGIPEKSAKGQVEPSNGEIGILGIIVVMLFVVSIVVSVQLIFEAIELYGSDEYIEISDSNSLDLTNAFTFSAWIKAGTWASDSIIDKWWDGTGRSYLLWAASEGELFLKTGSSTGGEPTGNGDGLSYTTNGMDMSTDTWYYITVVWNKDANGGKASFYKNGVFVEDSSDKKDDDFSPENMNLEEVEKILVRKVIDKHGGNISRAAKELGLTRASLYRRIEKHGI